MNALNKIRILQVILWLICSAVIIIVIAACSPAQAGCHIYYGRLWCDPDLGRVINKIAPHIIGAIAPPLFATLPPLPPPSPPPPPFSVAPPLPPPPPYIDAPPPVGPVGSPIVTAEYLTEACFSKAPTRNAGCAGFISGVADAYAFQGLYCLPPDHFAAERAVIDYIRRVPMQGLPATQIVLDALRALFPCH